MSDSSREYRPLLRGDNSDEECHYEFDSPLRRHMGHRGKAKNTIKGAAAIIKNWPDYWSSSVTYWWVGITMFALITFVFYNSIVAYSLLPTTESVPIPQTIIPNKLEIKEQIFNLPKIFMHVIVNNEKEANLNKYIPYIEIVANKHKHYNFNLIMLLNDTLNDEEAMHDAEMKNEDAMNSLWREPNVHERDRVPSKIKSNINIQYVNLSKYLDDSPLHRYWKQLPYQFIEVLVRAVSIWDKGGIAFSPIILTPNSPNPMYMKKLYSLLSSFEQSKTQNSTTTVNHKVENTEKLKTLNDHKHKYKKKVNNIRDIIDALEMEVTAGVQSQPEVLSEAENRLELSKLEINPPKSEQVVANISDNLTTGKFRDSHLHSHNNKSIKSTDIKLENQNNRSEILKIMLPSFLDFLFHDKPKTTTPKEDAVDVITAGDSMKRSTRTVSSELNERNDNNGNLMQPMIVSPPLNFENTNSKSENSAPMIYEDLENLTIDLNGNILATKSPCHVFLGTVFSNIKHHTEEKSVKDFIISELSLFCNGLLSTCKGVDVVLL